MLRIKLFLAALLLAPTGHGTGLPAPSTKPELQVLRIDKPNSVKVTLSSASQGSTRIWSAGNSWGAANWRVYIVRGTNLFLFREDPDQRFSRNSPKFEELKGVKHISLDFSTKFWIGPRTEFGAFSPGDKVIVAYEVPVTAEARLHGVWYGTIATMILVD